MPGGLFLLSGQYMMEGQGIIDTATCTPLGHTLLPGVVSWPVSLTSVMPDASERNGGFSPRPRPIRSLPVCTRDPLQASGLEIQGGSPIQAAVDATEEGTGTGELSGEKQAQQQHVPATPTSCRIPKAQTDAAPTPPPALPPSSRPSRGPTFRGGASSYSLARMTMSMPQKMLMIQPTMTMAVRIWMRAAAMFSQKTQHTCLSGRSVRAPHSTVKAETKVPVRGQGDSCVRAPETPRYVRSARPGPKSLESSSQCPAPSRSDSVPVSCPRTREANVPPGGGPAGGCQGLLGKHRHHMTSGPCR